MEIGAFSDKNRNRLLRLREAARAGAEICTERGYLLTKSFMQTEAHRSTYRKAAALAYILENKSIRICDDELIVGALTKKPVGFVLMPEVNSSWMNEYVATYEKSGESGLSDDEIQEFREMAEYWEGRCLYSRWQAGLPDEAKKIAEIAVGGMAYAGNGQNFGHFAIDFAEILGKGICGVLSDVNEAQRNNVKDLGDPAQYDMNCLYEDMKIELHSVIRYAHRYSELAMRMASAEKDATRRRELLKISEVCGKVPEFPPEDLWEALQSEFFIYEAMQLETFSHAASLGRVDQTFYPYYAMSRERGMSEEDASLLYGAFLIKIATAQQCPPLHRNESMFGRSDHGGGSGMVCTIGGTDLNGAPAVNEMSHIVLDMEKSIGFSGDLMIRVGVDTPEDFLVKALGLARDLVGKSKFLGDVTIMEQMRAFGRPEEEIPNYCVVGCTAPALPSYSLDVSGGIINLPLFLDLALHDGYSTVLGTQFGPHTGDPESFSEWEDVYAAFKAQYLYFLPYIHILSNVDKRLHGLYNPVPFVSALYPVCLDKGVDLYRGALGSIASYAFSIGGGPNVGDSLTAIRKTVFEDGCCGMGELVAALDGDFSGENGAKVLSALNSAPKFGNDNDEADGMVAEVMSWTSDATCAAPGEWGSTTTVAGAAVALNVALGHFVGATPDGRHSRTPLSEGGLSPCQGKNVSGITATFNSLLKMPHLKLHHGEVLNIRIDPSSVVSDDKLRKLALMVKSFLVSGGYLCQFNFVSADMLRDAQAHPDRYKDLLVRVATYSSYFVTLTKELQDDLIARSEMQV
jgi:formate C-acetyltransferase